MVDKRIKYVLYILMIISLFLSIKSKVNASTINLGTPTAQTYYDNAYHNATAQLVGWWGSNNYYSIRTPSPYMGGSSGGGSIVYRHVYTWNNANLCSGKNMLIKGYVGGLTNAFTQGVSIALYNNTYAMNCSTQIGENGSQIYYQCSGVGGGKLEIFFLLNEYYGKYFETAVSKSVDITCDVGNGDIITNNNNNTQSIINNQNNNTQSIINNQNQNAQQQHNDSTAINNNITNTYNFISSDTIDSNTNTDSISNNYDSTSNNAVLNFMLIPLNFVSSVINGFSNSCSQVCLGDCGSSGSGGIHDFNFRFVLPCIDIRSIIGNGVYNTIDALACVCMIFAFIRSVVGFAKKALLLEADVSSEVRVF